MTVTTISYSESRESVSQTGLKSWKKYSVDIELNDGDEAESVSQEAKKLVQSWLMDSVNMPFMQIDRQSISEGTAAVATYIVDLNHEKTEIAIDNAKSLEDLATLKPSCSTPELMKQYMKKVNELTIKIK